MKRIFMGIYRCEKGQALVEFTMVFPLVLLLVFGIMEFAFLSMAHQNVNYAAFQAARASIVGKKPLISAAITLYALTPNLVSGMSPFQFLKERLAEESTTAGTSMATLTDALVFALGGEGLKNMLTGKTSTVSSGDFIDFQKLLNGILQPMLSAANSVLDAAGEITPSFLRKAAYTYGFTRTETVKDTATNSLTVTVTYFYPLKFPVIRSLSAWFLQNSPGWFQGDEDLKRETVDGKIFEYTDPWDKAQEYSTMSGLEFVPIIHRCTMGKECGADEE